MSWALKLPPHRMTVSEFLEWDSGDTSGAIWQLRDGEPGMMAQASDAHGAIQAEVLRRQADGTWPEQPEIIGAEDEIRAKSIGFAVPLQQIYRFSGPV